MKLILYLKVAGWMMMMLLVGTSCVSSAKFKEQGRNLQRYTTENDSLISANEGLEVKIAELGFMNENQAKRLANLAQDSLDLITNLNALQAENHRLQSQLAEANENLASQRSLNEQNASNYASQLQGMQDNLSSRNTEVSQLNQQMLQKQKELQDLEAELNQRNKRMLELESIINKQDSATRALKAHVAEALSGLENNGLTVTTRDGKVYISLDEKLLFKSGSTKVDPAGEAALKKLATILEQNPDISITIEGHTDDVPLSPSSAMQDNWDLSVKRATSIVRILTQNSTIDPARLTAAGRGEYVPIDPQKTSEARQKNRRTEIILMPKLNELYQILQ